MAKTMADVWDLVQGFEKTNPVHIKRGIRFNDSPPDRILIRMTEELGEVCQAHTRDGNDLEEIADLQAILVHYARKKGFTQTQVAEAIFEKLGRVYY